MSNDNIKEVQQKTRDGNRVISPNAILPGDQQARQPDSQGRPADGVGNPAGSSYPAGGYYFVTPSWRSNLSRFIIIVLIMITGSLLFHLYCHDWHLFAPNHVPSHDTAALAFVALICLMPALLMWLAMTSEFMSVFTLVFPNVALGLFALLATGAGVPISSWIQTPSKLSSFREFEMFFLALFTGIQVVMIAEECLDISEWFDL